MKHIFVSFLLIVIALFGAIDAKVDLKSDPPQYGVDCSYPIHYGINRRECPYFYDQYHKMMERCFSYYSREECEQNERDRLRMNLAQAASQHNYTAIGFKKMKAPKEAWEPLIAFYNKYKHEAVTEKWYRGATIVNTWDAPSKMVSFENSKFRGGVQVKEQIWEGVRPVIQEWIGGYELQPTSLYGIRLYTDGSVLATHVDRLPLVSSCIINVDQDLDEPWPIEVYDHNGNAYNVTMEPGDMVLYESSTVLHGRPFPMKGRYFANVFVHFEPLAHAELNEMDQAKREGREPDNAEPLSVKRRHGGNINNNAPRNLRNNNTPRRLDPDEEDAKYLRLHAAHGNIEDMHEILQRKPQLLHASDENRWQALHEAIRSGKPETVKFLVELGADLKWKIKNGGTALWLAKDSLPSDHEIIAYLKSVGAPEH